MTTSATAQRAHRADTLGTANGPACPHLDSGHQRRRVSGGPRTQPGRVAGEQPDQEPVCGEPIRI